jgi:hypothetical protein
MNMWSTVNNAIDAREKVTVIKAVTLLTILFANEPDLMDAIIGLLGRIAT